MIGRALFLLGVTATAGKLLVKDRRIPLPIRAGLSLTAVCLFIPGPFDEMAILCLLGLVAVFWRQPLREAWAEARASREKVRVARRVRRCDAARGSDRYGHGPRLKGPERGSRW